MTPISLSCREGGLIKSGRRSWKRKSTQYTLTPLVQQVRICCSTETKSTVCNRRQVCHEAENAEMQQNKKRQTSREIVSMHNSTLCYCNKRICPFFYSPTSFTSNKQKIIRFLCDLCPKSNYGKGTVHGNMFSNLTLSDENYDLHLRLKTPFTHEKQHRVITGRQNAETCF